MDDTRIQAIRKIRDKYFEQLQKMIDDYYVKDDITESKYRHLENFGEEFSILFTYFIETQSMLMEALREKEINH